MQNRKKIFDISGKAIIISAPSGAGKTTIVKRLAMRIPTLCFSVSVTTRPKRIGEVHGKDYFFMSIKEFEQNKRIGNFLEFEEVYPHIFYGTLKSEIKRIWSQAKQVTFDVDVHGGLKLKQLFGSDALAIFVEVKDIEVLKARLINRNTESERSIQDRLNKAKQEMKYKNEFDIIIQNDQLETAVNQIEQDIVLFIK